MPYGGVNLGLSTAISAPDARNVANIVLSGVRPVEGERSPIMPGFAASMTDDQIAALLNYLRARFSSQPAWTGVEKTVADARRTQTVFLQTSPGPRNGPADPNAARQAMRASAMMTLKVNGHDHQIDADPDTPLLYVLREDLALNAAKFGCGLGQCGACTVMVDGKAVLSCVTPLVLLEGKQVTTLEGLGTVEAPVADPARLHGRAGGAMRLLHRRHDDAGAGVVAAEFQADRSSRSAPKWSPIFAAAAPTCASCARCIAPRD